MTAYTDMATWYKVNHILRYHYNIDDNTILNWLPFEREIELGLIKEDRERKKRQQV